MTRPAGEWLTRSRFWSKRSCNPRHLAPVRARGQGRVAALAWIMLLRVVAIGAFGLIPPLLPAQARDASRGEVAGTVYDSVTRSAVVGAIVQVVSAVDPSKDTYSATTDSRGRYAITGV